MVQTSVTANRADELTRHIRSGAVSLYWYDQHGRRVAKSESGLLTLYIWDGMDIIATAN